MHARRNPNLTVRSELSPGPSTAFLSPRYPNSATTIRLGRSPPPSPATLESYIPKQAKRRSESGQRLAKRVLIAIVLLLGLAYWAVKSIDRGTYELATLKEQEAQDAHNVPDKSSQYESVDGSEMLREKARPIMIQDKSGKPKWTVSIPDFYDFPLRPQQYREICTQAMEVAHHTMENGKQHMKRHKGFYAVDKLYKEVEDAQQQGLLPKPAKETKHVGAEAGLKACNSSLTFVMETSDAGMGNTLLELWMSYGLAQKEGRAFFVDDSRWAYGKYSDYFKPPPNQDCLPPSKSQIVPCPHQARHIVISSALTQHAFGHQFNEEFEDPRKMKVHRQHKIFAMLRAGYEALFVLREDDAKYVKERVEALYAPIKEAGGLSIGMHIRRGDRHPRESQYQKDYLPLDRFIDSAGSIILSNSSFASTQPPSIPRPAPDALPPLAAEIDTILAKHHSQLVLASDDPDIYNSPELSPPTTHRAQTRIILATKAQLSEASGSKGKPPKNGIDNITGWEGGFFKSVFWSLGMPLHSTGDPDSIPQDPSNSITLPEAEKPWQKDPKDLPEGVLRLRELVARSYLLDLAVLSRADAVVCGISATGCRVLGVMKGWEGVSEKEGSWRNVDGTFHWKGINW